LPFRQGRAEVNNSHASAEHSSIEASAPAHLNFHHAHLRPRHWLSDVDRMAGDAVRAIGPWPNRCSSERKRRRAAAIPRVHAARPGGEHAPHQAGWKLGACTSRKWSGSSSVSGSPWRSLSGRSGFASNSLPNESSQLAPAPGRAARLARRTVSGRCCHDNAVSNTNLPICGENTISGKMSTSFMDGVLLRIASSVLLDRAGRHFSLPEAERNLSCLPGGWLRDCSKMIAIEEERP
jgi:hypothetical protein